MTYHVLSGALLTLRVHLLYRWQYVSPQMDGVLDIKSCLMVLYACDVTHPSKVCAGLLFSDSEFFIYISQIAEAQYVRKRFLFCIRCSEKAVTIWYVLQTTFSILLFEIS